MLFLDHKSSPNQIAPPIHLDVETRVRGWTVTRVLEPTCTGMHEAVAEDAQGTPVLLRVPCDDAAVERIFAEAALAKRHRHWGIVHTIGVVDHDGWPVQVIEHVDGMSLENVGLLAGSLAPEAVCRVGSQIAMILVELQREEGGFHGALSAERVLVDAAGHVRLADLGRARPEQLFRLLSPERRASGGVGSPEDDLYALGGTLIEAALGRPLERTIGWIDTRALGGVLPERLIDALDALVAPSGRRLKNAAAVMRVFETLEATLGDGAQRLKKAVEYARLGVALGEAPEPSRPTLVAPDAVTETELGEAEQAAPEPVATTSAARSPFEPFSSEAPDLALTDPGSSARFVPFADATPASVAPASIEGAPDEETCPEAPAAATAESEPPLSDPAASFFAAAPSAAPPPKVVIGRPSVWPANEVTDVKPVKKKWPLFSRMIAWGFMALVATNVLAAAWVLAEPPLSRATGVALPKMPYSDLSFASMAGAAFASMAPELDGPGLTLSAADLQRELAAIPPADAAPPPPAADEAAALSTAEQEELAKALAALAAELEKVPAAAAAAEVAPNFDDAPPPSARPVGMPKRKAVERPLPPPSAPAPEKVVVKPAKQDKPVKQEASARPTKDEKAARPTKEEKAEKVAKPAKAEAPAARPAKSERRIIGSPENAQPTRPVKLTVEASAAMRARAEAKLRECEIEEPVLGVVRVNASGKVKSVSTDPLNPCVARVLKQTLEGFEEDAPFEVTP